MITLQQLLMSDSDLSGGTQTGKGTDGAQDFLALLAGALSDATGKGNDAPLTLADLKAAGSKLSHVAQDAKGDTTLQAKIADLLSRQTALNGDETSSVTSFDTRVSGLVPLSKGDALKTLNAVNSKDDGKSELSEEELAGLSALMAMLPHQQTSTSRAAGSDGVSATATLSSAALTQNGAGQPSLNALPGSHDKAQSAAPYQSRAKNSDPALSGNAPATPAVAATAEKQELASSSSSASPTATLAPIMSSHATSQTAATVATAPVLSQPLGTHEWQQSLSQHITLFTKQGQQMAELRLHRKIWVRCKFRLSWMITRRSCRWFLRTAMSVRRWKPRCRSCEPHWRRTAFSLRKAASAARALPGSSSPHPSSSIRLRVPATPAALMTRSMSYCLSLPLCNPPRAVTVP